MRSPFTQASERLTYELIPDWEQLPARWTHGDVAGVATDSRDRVFVFNRSEHPVIVYDRDGRFLRSWGEGLFTRPHGITIHDDVVYCADDTDHTVRALTLDGELLWTLGTPNVASDTGYSPVGRANLKSIVRGAGPFNRPTRLAVAANGDFYVSDGYGNARIHRFSPQRELILSWGEPGREPGQFNLPHSVWVHTDGRVFVCDRENDRVQIFSPDGELLGMWTGLARPGDLWIDADGNVIVGEMAWNTDETHLDGRPYAESRSAQLSVRDLEGNLLSRWGGDDPCAPGSFASPHGLCLDTRGDLYVGEVTHTALSRANRWTPACHSIQKFARVWRR
ncbi:MAG TPA: peptidyl-alpha-hydroxyglycine alpha-amidating lyase family protein [Chloroflexota bacterium]|nr:peptidyl-alpha-hydroxyglycine alpha-amidating lyase family protein [Chloroflexota bacterium]